MRLQNYLENSIKIFEAIPALHYKHSGKTTFFHGFKRASAGRFLNPGKKCVLPLVAFHFHPG
jgi:hypothetical protein